MLKSLPAGFLMTPKVLVRQYVLDHPMLPVGALGAHVVVLLVVGDPNPVLQFPHKNNIFCPRMQQDSVPVQKIFLWPIVKQGHPPVRC